MVSDVANMLSLITIEEERKTKCDKDMPPWNKNAEFQSPISSPPLFAV